MSETPKTKTGDKITKVSKVFYEKSFITEVI
jgi:hypothetical protein